MTFRLTQARFDRESRRAYVELRDEDDDGGDAIAVVIFSYRRKDSISKHELEDDLVRKARNILKRASSAA